MAAFSIFVYMIFDIVIIISLLFAFYRGWKKGLLWSLFSMLAFFISLFVAMKFASDIAQLLQEKNIVDPKYAYTIAFVFIIVLLFILFKLLSKSIEHVLKIIFLGWLNPLLGALFYGFILLFFYSTLLWLSNILSFSFDDQLKHSICFKYIKEIAPFTFEFLRQHFSFFNEIYNKIITLH